MRSPWAAAGQAAGGPAQLGERDGGGAQLAHHPAGGQVGQGGGLLPVAARGEGGGEGGDDGVAGAGDVVHLARLGGEVELGAPGAQEGHAVLTAGDQQGGQAQVAHEGLPLGHQGGLVGTGAHHRLEFGQVGGDAGGPPVAAEVVALGVHQHRQAVGAGALAVVGEDEGADPLQLHRARQGTGGLGGVGLFEVQADELLMAAEDAQLGDRGQAGDGVEAAFHPGRLQGGGEGGGGLVVAGEAVETHPHPQAGA